MPDKIARLLGHHKLLNIKEITESFEFFQRVRHRVRRRVMVDLCCGHGLVGLLFALLEREVEEVYLLDLSPPPSAQRLIDALNTEWPWVSSKVRWMQRTVKGASTELPRGSGVVSVHACGGRTDWSIQVALDLESPFAMMPCCYAQQSYRGPDALRHQFGTAVSIDINRTYRLEAQGLRVSWQEIPEEITPMNRILSASPSSIK